jgi:glycosyltransferase involved in cell wall biosynthesis
MVAACPFPYPRGTPVRIYKLAEALAHRSHDVHVVTYHLGQAPQQVPFTIHRTPAIKTYQKTAPGPAYQKLLLLDVLLAAKLSQVLQQHDIELIHAHHYEGLLVARLAQLRDKRPLVYDAHTLLESELPFYGLALPRKGKKVLGYWLDRLLPKRATHIITVTETIRRKLIANAKIPPQQVTTVPNGVEWEHFAIDPGIQPVEGQKTLVFAGNLAPYQRVDLLLQAFRAVLNKRPDVRLHIISDSPFDRYEALAKTFAIQEHIDLLRSDFERLPQLLAVADVALNPRTKCDGIPLKLLNYMAAGKAIVSFAGSAQSLNHGKTGWVVENENTSVFASAILHLLENPRLARTLGANARQQVISEYTWGKMAERAEAVYEQLCRLPRREQERMIGQGP